jgi:hypothetical protein
MTALRFELMAIDRAQSWPHQRAAVLHVAFNAFYGENCLIPNIICQAVIQEQLHLPESTMSTVHLSASCLSVFTAASWAATWR